MAPVIFNPSPQWNASSVFDGSDAFDNVAFDTAPRSSMPASPASIGLLPNTWGAPTAISNTPFAGFLSEAVGQVGLLETQARTAVEGLMSGKGVDVHEAMIATEKAEMGFELMLSVRNKALAAYQQIVGMQF